MGGGSFPHDLEPGGDMPAGPGLTAGHVAYCFFWVIWHQSALRTILLGTGRRMLDARCGLSLPVEVITFHVIS